MSATIGTPAALTIAGNAAVDASSGHETRTMSAPASSSARTWAMVAAASAVSVLVIDWTLIGASPPTSTEPTRILRVGRRWIARQGRTCSSEGAVMAGRLDRPFRRSAQARHARNFCYGWAAGAGVDVGAAGVRLDNGVVGPGSTPLNARST